MITNENQIQERLEIFLRAAFENAPAAWVEDMEHMTTQQRREYLAEQFDIVLKAAEADLLRHIRPNLVNNAN